MSTQKKSIVFVVANPTTSPLTGWPIGFWLSELAHPYWELSQQGFQITLASPEGGQVVPDGMSDPENPRGNPNDFLSLGFKHSPITSEAMLETARLADVRVEDFDAIFVVGGLSPMVTFIEHEPLHRLFASFHDHGKVCAAVCHGTCVLLRARLASGELLAAGRRWTGFSNAEEDAIDRAAGKKVEPFRIEDEAHRIGGTTFVAGPPFVPHAVRDGRLVTGQQGSSGAAVARLVIEALQER